MQGLRLMPSTRDCLPGDTDLRNISPVPMSNASYSFVFGLRLEICQGSLWEKWRAKVNSNPEGKGKVKGDMPNSVKITPVREARVPGHGIGSGNVGSSGECVPKLEFEACTKLRTTQTQTSHFRRCPNEFQKIESCCLGLLLKAQIWFLSVHLAVFKGTTWLALPGLWSTLDLLVVNLLDEII